MISLKNILLEQSNSNTDWAPSIEGIYYHQKNTDTNKAQSFFDKNPGALTDPNLPVKDRYADFDKEKDRLANLTTQPPYIGTVDEDKWLDNIQNIADWIGLVPAIGDIIDIINAAIYFLRGKYSYAFLSIVAMIPVVGSVVALPFKAVFKLVGPIVNGIFRLIMKGSGTKAAQQLITSLAKIDKTKAVELISVCKQHATKIESWLQPINNKLDELRTFNNVAVPNFLIRRINSMAETCFPLLKGTTEFLTEIAETNVKDVIPKAGSEFINPNPNVAVSDLAKKYASGDKGAIAVYSKAQPDIETLYMVLPDRFKENAYVQYKRIFDDGIPTNKIEMKVDMILAEKGQFKEIMTNLSKILPDHILTETTSISSDGLTMWANQIKNGYVASNKRINIRINNAGRKVNMKNAPEGPIPEKDFDRNSLSFSSKAEAEAAINKLTNETKINQIPNAKISIEKDSPAMFYLNVDIPELISSQRSIEYYGIDSKSIPKSVLAMMRYRDNKEQEDNDELKVEESIISMKELIIEGRYDSLVTKLSNTLLGVVKDSYSCVESEDGMFAGKQTFFAKGDSVPHIEEHPEIYFEEIEAPNVQLEFYLTLKIQWIEGLDAYRYGGDAFNDKAKDPSVKTAEFNVAKK